MGLGDKATALTSGAKAMYGNRGGARLDRVLMGSAGDLSKVVRERNPVMAYALEASSQERENLSRLGWKAVWDRPGGVVFYKEPQPQSRR